MIAVAVGAGGGGGVGSGTGGVGSGAGGVGSGGVGVGSGAGGVGSGAGGGSSGAGGGSSGAGGGSSGAGGVGAAAGAARAAGAACTAAHADAGGGVGGGMDGVGGGMDRVGGMGGVGGGMGGVGGGMGGVIGRSGAGGATAANGLCAGAETAAVTANGDVDGWAVAVRSDDGSGTGPCTIRSMARAGSRRTTSTWTAMGGVRPSPRRVTSRISRAWRSRSGRTTRAPRPTVWSQASNASRALAHRTAPSGPRTGKSPMSGTIVVDMEPDR